MKKFHPIYIGAGVIDRLPKFIRSRKSRKVVLIADRRLKSARQELRRLLANEFELSEIAVDAGEGFKDIESVYPIYGELLNCKADRDTLILALGGGSIGDAAGFIASTYLRGIDWVGLPTTLLAQVDSSIGGKTGINHREGKNLIGTFHQPKLVICDTQFLNTLGKREITSGLGEVIKYSLTFDPRFFSSLVKNLSELQKLQKKPIQSAIEKSLAWKCKAVMKDEFDRTGVREVLNFGHTFGHALESVTQYERYQHGEAVIWGMRFALALSVQRGHLKPKEHDLMDGLLARLPVPALPKGIASPIYFQAMKKDKKSSQNRVRFVLLDRLGHSISDSGVTESDLQSAFDLLMKKLQKKVKRG